MRYALLCLGALIFGCVPFQIPVTAEEAALTAQAECYVTAAGVKVLVASSVKCPALSELEERERRLFEILYDMKRQEPGVPKEGNRALEGLTVVVVWHEIRCGPSWTVGCSNDEWAVISTKAVYMPRSRLISTVYDAYEHELTHMWLSRMGRNPDGEHRDCLLWFNIDHVLPPNCFREPPSGWSLLE